MFAALAFFEIGVVGVDGLSSSSLDSTEKLPSSLDDEPFLTSSSEAQLSVDSFGVLLAPDFLFCAVRLWSRFRFVARDWPRLFKSISSVTLLSPVLATKAWSLSSNSTMTSSAFNELLLPHSFGTSVELRLLSAFVVDVEVFLFGSEVSFDVSPTHSSFDLDEFC